MVDLVSTPEQLTAEWLTEALNAANALGGARVTGVARQLIGTGKMGDNVRLTLTYDARSGAPATLVAKLPARDETARGMAGALGAYYNESMFYRHLAAGARMNTPRIYANELSEDGMAFVLLMEDLAPAEPGSQLVGETLERTRLALMEAAKLAAAYYADESLATLDYVSSNRAGQEGFDGPSLMAQFWPQFLERFGYGISDECRGFGDLYVERCAVLADSFKGDKTLIHGDFRTENILFGADRATVVDWQTVTQSSALTDAAYFLGGSVEIADRRCWEQGLVTDYAEQLRSAGVPLDNKACWHQYREFAMHGIPITVLGACFSAPAERSDQMFLAMIQRHLQQCVDLQSADFLI